MSNSHNSQVELIWITTIENLILDSFTRFYKSICKENHFNLRKEIFLSIQFASRSYGAVCFTLNVIQLLITTFGFSLQKLDV